MSAWTAFLTTASWLRPLIDGLPPRTPEREPNWKSIAAVSSSQMVTPALGISLAKVSWVREDFAAYVHTLLALARSRNEAILKQLSEILVLLNSADIAPILLKGAGDLIDGIADPGYRIFYDVDLLIRPSEVQEADRILQRAGYSQRLDNRLISYGSHHLPPLAHESRPAIVELHSEVMNRYYQRMINSRQCWTSAKPLAFGNIKVLVPSATDRVVHSIAHAELVNGCYARRATGLRQLLDVALLRSRYEADIDWHEVMDRFAAMGESRVLEQQMNLLHSLFGQPTPCGPTRSRTDLDRLAKAWTRRSCRRRAELLYTIGRCVRRLRHEPLTILNAFSGRQLALKVARFRSRLA